MNYTTCTRCNLELASNRNPLAMPFHKMNNNEIVCHICYGKIREVVNEITNKLNETN